MSGRISRLTLHEIKRIHHQKEFSSDGSAKNQSRFDDKRHTIDDGIETLAYVYKYAK